MGKYEKRRCSQRRNARNRNLGETVPPSPRRQGRQATEKKRFSPGAGLESESFFFSSGRTQCKRVLAFLARIIGTRVPWGPPRGPQGTRAPWGAQRTQGRGPDQAKQKKKRLRPGAGIVFVVWLAASSGQEEEVFSEEKRTETIEI